MTRENKRLEKRLQATQGKEINAVFNKLVEEFNPFYLRYTFSNPETGTVDIAPELEDILQHFHKRWNAWRAEYLKNKKMFLNIKPSAFMDYVSNHIKQRNSIAFSNWCRDLQKILDKNTAKPIKVDYKLYKGQNLNSCAHDILVKDYWSNRKLCFKIWFENKIRQLFRRQSFYPAIEVLITQS